MKKYIPCREILVEDIGSAVDIHPYKGQGYEGGMSGVHVCSYPAPSALCDGSPLRDACGVRPMRVCGFPFLSDGRCGRRGCDRVYSVATDFPW